MSTKVSIRPKNTPCVRPRPPPSHASVRNHPAAIAAPIGGRFGPRNARPAVELHLLSVVRTSELLVYLTFIICVTVHTGGRSTRPRLNVDNYVRVTVLIRYSFQVKALYDFNGEPGSVELSIKAGELLTLVRDVGSGWYEGENARGQIGLFPENYVQVVEKIMVNSGDFS
jgi:SH3 domain